MGLAAIRLPRGEPSAAITGDYEGVLSVGVGMRKQTWIKAFTLTGRARVVIDASR